MALPVYNIEPEFPVERWDVPNVVQTNWRDGIFRQRRVYPRDVRRWRLGHRDVPETDRDSALSLFAQSRGTVQPMTWTPVDEATAVSVQWSLDTLEMSHGSSNAHDFTVDIHETLNDDD